MYEVIEQYAEEGKHVAGNAVYRESTQADSYFDTGYADRIGCTVEPSDTSMARLTSDWQAADALHGVSEEYAYTLVPEAFDDFVRILEDSPAKEFVAFVSQETMWEA